MNTLSIDNDIKLEDNINPFKPFLKSENSPLSSSIYKFLVREMSEIRLNTDKDLLFNSNEETRSYKFAQKREEVDMREENENVPGAYSQMNINASGNTIIYKRRYKKLFEVFIEIGGFFNGVNFIALIILYIYSKNIILWQCIYSLIPSNELDNRLKENLQNINKNKDYGNIINVNKSLQEERKENNNRNIERNISNSSEELNINRNNIDLERK
jgi:hypothetical protein